jgi:hypothetical protein
MAMSDIHKLEKQLRALLPNAGIELSAPADEDGYWFLDVVQNSNGIVARGCKGGAIGLASLDRNSFGGGPDEVYQSAEAAAARIQELLAGGGRTVPPAEVTLRELRAERNLSQVQLARLLGVEQPAVSRQEGRVAHMRLDTLRSVARAMGGTLVVQVHFPDGMVRSLNVEEEENGAVPARREAAAAGS